MKLFKVALGGAVVASLLVAGSIALGASTPPKGGTVHIYGSETSAVRTKLLFTGAIGDYGSALTVTKDGKADPNGTFEQVKLKQGSFVIDTTPLGNKLSKTKPEVNAATCSFSLSATGPTTLSNGTGLYAGIGGTVRITFTVAGVRPFKNGKCNQKAQPLSQFTSIIGAGKASFH